jgi:beta-phosphoglucomutase-like phosphatase (HAD superfamily)
VKTALLFDLDGTLVDTDALHLAAFQTVFAGHGVALTKAQYVGGIMGYSNPLIGEAFLPHLTQDERRRSPPRRRPIAKWSARWRPRRA